MLSIESSLKQWIRIDRAENVFAGGKRKRYEPRLRRIIKLLEQIFKVSVMRAEAS